MQLLNNKLLKSILVVMLLFIGFTSSVSANSPDVRGKVLFTDGRPIPNIWVKWVDGNGSYRYAMTDGNGEYYFPSWTPDSTREALRDENGNIKRIDTDYNGSPDTPIWAYSRSGMTKGDSFNCNTQNHSFTALKRPDMIGTFNTPAVTYGSINNNGTITVATFYFNSLKPSCPTNMQYSCNASNSSVTLSWNNVEGMKRFNLQLNIDPYAGYPSQGDHYREGTWVKQDFPIQLNKKYTWAIETVKTVGGTDYFSGFCAQEFMCSGSGNTIPQTPSATLNTNACEGYFPADGDTFFANTSLTNIDTKGAQFSSADLYVFFSYNSVTQRILTHLSGSLQADKSQWQDSNRTPRAGDWFAFRVGSSNLLQSGNRVDYRITDSTTIGKTNIRDLRDFLKAQGLPITYRFSADLKATANGSLTENKNILAGQFTNFASCGAGGGDPGGGDASCSEALTCTKVTFDELEGGVIVPIANKIRVTWEPVGATSAATHYELLVFNKNSYNGNVDQAYQFVKSGGTAPDIAYSPNLTETTRDISLSEYSGLGDSLIIAVRGSCAATAPATCEWSQTTVTQGIEISGSFYKQDDNSCVATGPTVSLDNPVISVTDLNGNAVLPSFYDVTSTGYRVAVPKTAKGYYVDLSFANSEYSCATCNPLNNGKCRIDSIITTTNTQANFFVKDAEPVFANPWWQVFGGHIYSSGNMNSILPNTGTQPFWFLMNKAFSGTPETAGIPITGIDGSFGSEIRGYLSDRTTQLQAEGARVDIAAVKTDFAYYKEKLRIGDSYQQLPPTITQPSSDLNGSTTNGVIVHYRRGDLAFKPQERWNIPAGQHHLILVDGNIIFSSGSITTGDQQLVSVEQGGTVMFVASGNIVVSGDIGNSDLTSTKSNLEGIYVGDNIIIEGYPTTAPDIRFVGAGSFYGWSGVQLNRRFNDITHNADTPTEAFIYRPDFVINLPDALRDSSIVWREVN